MRSEAKLRRRLAEGEEGESEGTTTGRKRKKFYPEVCGKLAERNEQPKAVGLASVGSVGRFGAKHFTTERSGLEISEAWVGL